MRMPAPEQEVGDTPHVLSRDSLPIVRGLMLDQERMRVGVRGSVDPTFVGCMAFLRVIRPDVYLFTYKSAVPVADSVRGFYEELGEDVPVLLAVDANSRLARVPNQRFNRRIDEEAARLAPRLEGMSVGIIDQCISTRSTLGMAHRVAVTAGAAEVRTLPGANWYHDARRRDIDRQQMTSRFAAGMRDIGREAARRFADPSIQRTLQAGTMSLE